MSKRAVVVNAIRKTQSSYWFLPTVLVGLAVVAAEVSLYLDHNQSSLFYFWPEAWKTTQVEGARATLSVISQSVLGVVGVMFSVTIVAVSFASGNFGPRLVGNFMRDRGTQWSLGILISTFVFALLILRSLHSADDTDGASLAAFVPHMSVGIAMTLMGLSIMVVIYYVHHIPETINVSNISADLGKKLRLAVEKVINDGAEDTDEGVKVPDGNADYTVGLERNGYIQTFDKGRLTELATEHDLYIQITQDVGAFVNEFSVVMEVWSDQTPDDDLYQNLRGCFVVGSTPTEDQNLLFILQQLVEMIARALSPGVNDPYTAINCLNWLYAGLSTASNYQGGLKIGNISRVRSVSLTFSDMFHSGIVLSYPYIKTDALTHSHLQDILNRLVSEMEPSEDADIVANFLKTMDVKDTTTTP